MAAAVTGFVHAAFADNAHVGICALRWGTFVRNLECTPEAVVEWLRHVMHHVLEVKAGRRALCSACGKSFCCGRLRTSTPAWSYLASLWTTTLALKQQMAAMTCGEMYA